MLDLIAAIQRLAKQAPFAPAIINGDLIISRQDLLRYIASVSNYFSDRRLRSGRIFINVKAPDLRLIITLAAMHVGLRPLISAELGTLRAGADFDYVVGGPVPHIPTLPSDIIVDDSVLGGKLADPELRDFGTPAKDDVLYLAASSGTTGERKFFNAYCWVVDTDTTLATGFDQVRDGERVLLTIGDTAKYGITLTIRILRSGGVLVREDRDQDRLLKLLNLHRVERIITTPAWIENFLRFMDETKASLPTLREIFVTGSLLRGGLVEKILQLPSIRLVVNYGSAEAGLVTMGLIEAETFRPGYVGDIADGVTVLECGTREAPGPIRLLKKNRVVSPASQTERPVEVDSIIDMPDAGYVEGRALFLTGRSDEVVNCSGTKVPFSRLEDILRSYPGVEDAAVANLPFGEGAVAGIVGGVDLGALAAHAQQQVPQAILAGVLSFFRTSSITRNQTGKVDRTELVAASRARA